MKKNIRFLSLLILSVWLYAACNTTGEVEEQQAPTSFLQKIRPQFFESINFNSEAKRAQLPVFLKDFTNTYTRLEMQHQAGQFTSMSDLENMRLAGMYYSFGLTAVVMGYLDGFVKFEEIVGGQEKGLFSGLPVTDPDFRQQELDAMMKRSQEVAHFALYVNGFSDRTYATFMLSRQIRERVKSKTLFNNPVVQDSMIRYLESDIYDYQLYKEWNLLMSQLSFTNYHDSLNTFQNERMNAVLAKINSRLVITSPPDLNGRYPELLGPVFRFDLNMKKMDWLLHRKEVLATEDLDELKKYIATLEGVGNFVQGEKKLLLNSWQYKETITQRLEKLKEIKAYVNSESLGSRTLPKPVLAPYFTSKDFLQAYQCYNCHRSADNLTIK